jgi:hypothetical protein
MMDIAVGRLVRAMPLFEVVLLFTREAALGSRGDVELDRGGASGAIDELEGVLLTFPQQDRLSLARALADAREVTEFRQAIVHGRWTLLGENPLVYQSERVLLSRKRTRQLTGRDDVTDEDHPIIRLTFNADAVLATLDQARDVSRYLNDNLDRWEAHFGMG